MRATFLLFLATALYAQQPHLTNARLENRTLHGNFHTDFAQLIAGQSSPAWVAYSVPMLPGKESMCCWDASHTAACSLESRHGDTTTGIQNGPVKLEGPRLLFVFLRAENGTVGKVRAFNEDCAIDAGGLPVIWLGPIGTRESLAELAALAPAHEDAMAAIAFHDGPEADHTLEAMAAPGQTEKMREKALFWLGVARGHSGFEIVRRFAASDPSDHVRDKAVFALFVSKDPASAPAIISIAKQDRSDHVRGQAIFWLSQKAGAQQAAAIKDAIASDPSTEVKKKAVFALQQLPPDEGIPLLIEVARNNQNPEVRKQAIFWLGQTHDPRALAFFEQILK
jgi:HEAT repeats